MAAWFGKTEREGDGHNMASDTRECPFCAETIKAKARKCRYGGEFLDGYTRESVLGDEIEVGGIDDVTDAAIGRQTQAVQASDVEGPVIQAWRDVTMSKSQRDEQYDIVMNWDGKTRMRDFDLAGRNLSDLRLGNADLREANLREADLSRADLTKTDLVRANLSRADLHGADLRAAFLIKSDLREADLHGANLSRASGLSRIILLVRVAGSHHMVES
jgi:hypothetical protein